MVNGHRGVKKSRAANHATMVPSFVGDSAPIQDPYMVVTIALAMQSWNHSATHRPVHVSNY